MIHSATLIAIVFIAVTTYLTRVLGYVLLKNKTLTNDESIGLLKIISDYAFALDILDQYDYQKLEIRNTSGISFRGI